MASFLISLPALRANAQILRQVADDAQCQIVLALKGFSCWPCFPAISKLLDGCCASGLWEAQLAHRHFGQAPQILTYSPAYSETEFHQLCALSHHLDFNSPSQWLRFQKAGLNHPRYQSGHLHFGLRINPEYSTGQTPLYDPCAHGSRLGLTAAQLHAACRRHPSFLQGISGLHFHTLCEQLTGDLALTLQAVEQKFGRWLASPQITHLNLGGGHWITKPNYDRTHLVHLIQQIAQRYRLKIWLEPGEAVAIHTGILRTRVLDTFTNQGIHHAILDISATAHTPDVLEMPYRPEIYLVEPSSQPKPQQPSPQKLPCVTLPSESYKPTTNPNSPEKPTPANHNHAPPPEHHYRLGGLTCLAGDSFGDYSFSRPLHVGDTLVLDDMSHYTMVKTTTFNGVPHPDICLLNQHQQLQTIRHFTYSDYENRLA